jgi:hypothetical protein
MNLLMKLTHNSLATMIAWVSTCLLAGWASTLFSESARTTWMTWGSFGLAAAVGLDFTARIRERIRIEGLKVTANKRFDRDISFETQEIEAIAAIRAAVTRILGRSPPAFKPDDGRRTQQRFPCKLEVELLLELEQRENSANGKAFTHRARVTNLSESGFELMLAESVPQQRMKMSFASAKGGQETLLGELLWCSLQTDGSFAAGGRFLNVLSVDGA